MINLIQKMRTAFVNAGFSIAILIGLILFKRFAVRVHIEVSEIQSRNLDIETV